MKTWIAALLAASISAGGSPDTQAQREAVALKKEGDQRQAEGRPQEARERWAKALEAYQRSGFKPGQIEVLFRIGASYQAEAGVEPQKQSLFLDAMVRGLLTTAEFLQEVVPRLEPKDRDSVQRGDELFAETSKLTAAGDCGSAVPLLIEAGKLYEAGGSAAGQAGCQAERLRCLLKAPNPVSLVMAMGEVMTLLETWKPQFQIGPATRYLQAIDAEGAGERTRAEELYRDAIKDFEAAGDRESAARATRDLEGLLADPDKTAKPETPSIVAEESVAPVPVDGDRQERGSTFTLGSRAQAQREATLLLGEADRLLQAGRLREARERWLASAEAFQRASNRQGVATCYRRLGDSYAGEAMFDARKMLLSAEYYGRVMAELAKEAEEIRGRNEPGLPAPELREAASLLEEASGLVDLGGCERAMPLLVRARSLYQQAHLAYGEVRSLALQGRCHAEKGDLRSAFSISMEGLSVLTTLSLDTPTSELALKAADLLEAGKWAEAMELYQKVLGQYEEAKDAGGIASTLLEIGGAQFFLGAFAEAEASLSRALSLLPAAAGELGRSDEAAVHHNLGGVYAATGRSAEAVAELRLALCLWRELGEIDHEVATLSALGVALNDQGDPEAALAALAEAEKLQSALSPDPEMEGDLLNNRGKVHYSQGRYQEALDLFGSARALYETLPIRLKEAQVVNNIALIESALGRFPQALSGFEKAQEMARQLGAAHLEMGTEANEASALFASGQYQAAIRVYLRLLARATTQADQQLVVGVVHNNLGAAYLRLGDPAKSSSHFTQALEVARRLGNRENEASILVNRGQAYSYAGHRDLAKADTECALKIWKDLGNNVMANRALVNLGWWIESFSEEDLQAFRSGLESSRKAGLASDSLRYSLLIGAVLVQRGDFAGALEQAAPAIADADRIGDAAGQFAGRTMRLFAHFRQGDSAAALRDLAEMVAGLDRWQSGLTLSELKSSFLAQFSDLYALGVQLNAGSGRPEEAFAYAEQARARAFLDQIGNQRIAVRRGVDPELTRQEGDLRAQLAHLGRSIRSEAPGSERLRSLQQAWQAAQSEYATLLARLKLADPEYANLISVSPLKLKEVQQLLDGGTTLIEYFVADPREHAIGSTPVLAWVVDRDRATMVWLPVSTADLSHLVELYRNLIESRRPVEPLAAELYSDLFAPLAPHVRHENLVIVPHGVLHFLPFAALWDGKSYLGDSYALSYSPSATALKLAREKKAAAVGPILAVGNPDGSLPHAAAEAQAVARRYGAQPLLGAAASEGAVVARAGQAGILHLAAHAVLNPVNPLFTRIELAPDEGHDGSLEMHEVFGLDLSRTGLVVLSACRTQLGQLTAGDEIEGLTRAFLYAGTPAVMSSLWDVQDDSTSFLMERFYTHLRQGQGRAEALRRAQMETRRRHPHPYHWAAFVLTGDGRPFPKETLERHDEPLAVPGPAPARVGCGSKVDSRAADNARHIADITII